MSERSSTNEFRSCGILNPIPSSGFPGHWWLLLKCCRELGRYYRYLCLKWTPCYREMGEPLWKPHITVVRRERCDEKLIKPLDGQEVEFWYQHELQTNDRHFWLTIRSPQLVEIRERLGLSQTPVVPLHLTVAAMPNE